MHYMGTEAEYPVYQPGLEQDRIDEVDYRRGHPSERAIRYGMLKPQYLPKGIIGSDAHVSDMLSNGDRLYPESASDVIVEMATGERLGALATMLCDQRGIALVQEVAKNFVESDFLASSNFGQDIPFYLLRRTVDAGQKTTGYHINQLIPRRLWIGLSELAPVFMTMIGGMALFGGGALDQNGEFTIFQKSAQVKEYIMGSTTDIRKPLINIRPEPHANQMKYQRLHIVGNDILHSPWATWLRLGVLEMAVELCERDPQVAQGLAQKLPQSLERAIKAFTADPEFITTTTGFDGREYTATDYMDIVGDALKDAVGSGFISTEGKDSERTVVMEEFDWARDANRYNPGLLEDLVDWRYRRSFLHKAREKGRTPMQLAQLDISVDDLCDRKLPRAYQDPIRHIGLERLALAHAVPLQDLVERAVDLHYVEPGGRAEVRANRIKEYAADPTTNYRLQARWDSWNEATARVYVDDPASQELRRERWVWLAPSANERGELPIDY